MSSVGSVRLTLIVSRVMLSITGKVVYVQPIKNPAVTRGFLTYLASAYAPAEP